MWHKRIFLVLVSIGLTLIAIELGLRLVVSTPQSVVIQDLHAPVEKGKTFSESVGLTAPDMFYRTPTGLRLQPGVQGVITAHDLSKKRVVFSTNSLGYRHGELGEKSVHDYRILALGDSITFAEYLPIEETYPYQLEQYLRIHPTGVSQGKSIDVINAGVGMIGAENELAILFETGVSVKPDVVLVELFLNDAQESFSLKIIKAPPILNKSYLVNLIARRLNLLKAKELGYTASDVKINDNALAFIRQNPVHPVTSSGWQTDQTAFNRLIAEYYHDWGYAWDDAFWVQMEHVYGVMEQIARERGFQLVVVLFPVRYQVQAAFLRDEPQQRFDAVMNKLGIAHLDLLPALREQFASSGANVFYDHAHPTAEGMGIIAQTIGAFLTAWRLHL